MDACCCAALYKCLPAATVDVGSGQLMMQCLSSHLAVLSHNCLLLAQAAEAEALLEEQLADMEAGRRVDIVVAADLMRTILADEGVEGATRVLKKLNVENGPVGKLRVLYSAIVPDADDSSKFASAIKEYAALLRSQAPDAALQLASLVAFEYVVALLQPERMKEAALALKAMYDEDLAEEDIILAWYDRNDCAAMLEVPSGAAAELRTQVKPIIEWLREAESDDGDKEDDEDDDDAESAEAAEESAEEEEEEVMNMKDQQMKRMMARQVAV